MLNGDRGLSYSQTRAGGLDGRRRASGGRPTTPASRWSPSRPSSPRGCGLKIGDTVTVNVLGRNVTARIANLREVKWESLSINFVMVFSPNTLAGAPHNLLATDHAAQGRARSPPRPSSRSRSAAPFRRPPPSASRMRSTPSTPSSARSWWPCAPPAASRLLAGALVLAGALATAQRRRIQQAVILKTLGATSRRILLSHLAEYLVLASLTAFISLLIGSLAAWITRDPGDGRRFHLFHLGSG